MPSLSRTGSPKLSEMRAAWLLSGQRFLDWAYAMPDLGRVDDTILTILDRADAWRATLGLGDPFGDMRAALHRATGLGARP